MNKKILIIGARGSLGKQIINTLKFFNYADYIGLNRKDVDGVVVSTPDHWHAVMSIDAMRLGKHVYCEKPLSHTIKEGRAMVNASKKYDRVLQTGSMQRSSSNFLIGCQLVRNGYLGKISQPPWLWSYA